MQRQRVVRVGWRCEGFQLEIESTIARTGLEDEGRWKPLSPAASLGTKVILVEWAKYSTVE
jgi:hypothetical protein